MKTGHCLCQKVGVSINPPEQKLNVCHCGMCRKWSGGPGFVIDGGKEVSFTGQEFISKFSSSDWGERGFCKECGTHLFWHMKNSNYYNFNAGLFEDLKDFKFSLEIYIDFKPEYYSFANDTHKMTEADVIKLMSSYNG